MSQHDLFAVASERPILAPASRLIEVGKKYRNQPYEVLLGDPQYAIWLLTCMHDAIKQRHPALFSFLMSRFGQPDRTPDHNRLQNRFLDNDVAICFALISSPGLRESLSSLKKLSIYDIWKNHVEKVLSEAHLWAQKAPKSQQASILSSAKARLLKEGGSLIWFCSNWRMDDSGDWENPLLVSKLEFEDQGADVSYVVSCKLRVVSEIYEHSTSANEDIGRFSIHESFRVEVKPVVGDDYPAILRSMKAVKSKQLLVGTYCGAGATWEEVVKVFALSGISAVQLSELEDFTEEFKKIRIKLISIDEVRSIIEETYQSTAKILI